MKNEIKVENKYIINISDKNINKIIKKTKYLRKLCDKNNYKLIFKINGKEITKEDNLNLYNIQKAINIKNIKERYNFIYDKVCEYIDKEYLTYNYCDFKNDVCIYFRKEGKLDHKDGCCYSKDREGTCTHLKNHRCKIKAISCKLYSCPYLRENNINFKINDFPLIKYFFNIKQKYYLKYSFFKPKSYVIYKLIESQKEW